jgi:hypothetical protein
VLSFSVLLGLSNFRGQADGSFDLLDGRWWVLMCIRVVVVSQNVMLAT